MSAHERLERVREHLVVRFDPAWDVRGDRQVGERNPPGKDHVDEHQHLLLRRPDEDVALRVVGPVVVKEQLVLPPPDARRRLEDPVRLRPVGVVHLLQELGRVLVCIDAQPLVVEDRRRPDVVGVVVGVHEVGDRSGRHPADGPQYVVADRRRSIDRRHATPVAHEDHLVQAARQPEQVVCDLIQEEALSGIFGPMAFGGTGAVPGVAATALCAPSAPPATPVPASAAAASDGTCVTGPGRRVSRVKCGRPSWLLLRPPPWR